MDLLLALSKSANVPDFNDDTSFSHRHSPIPDANDISPTQFYPIKVIEIKYAELTWLNLTYFG